MSVSCGICLENLSSSSSSSSTSYALECSHVFHKSCISKWFKTQLSKHQNMSCPYCRATSRPINNQSTGASTENTPNESRLSEEQIKILLTDGIITLGSLLYIESVSHYFPNIHNFGTRLQRIFSRPHARHNLLRIYSEPSFSFPKLLITLACYIFTDYFFEE